MAKETATKDQFLTKIKNQGEYKNAQRDKATLKRVLDKFNGIPLFEDNKDPFVWPKFGKGKTIGKGKNAVKVPTYTTNNLYVGTQDVKSKLSGLNISVAEIGRGKGVKIFVGDHPVNITSSGASGGLQAAQITAMQERGSAVVFEHAISKNKVYNSYQDIAKDKEVMAELLKIWKSFKQDVVDVGWLESFYKQQSVLIKEVGRPTVHKYNRDGGFMKFISDIVSTEYDISKKDNWDPADIWLIRHEDRAKKIIERIVKKNGTIEELNATMRALFHALPTKAGSSKYNQSSPAVFGISLKKIGSGDARIEFANHSQAFFKSLESIRMTYLHTVCDLSTKEVDGMTTLGTQDSKFVVENGEHYTYSFQIKANDSKKISGLKYEPTMKGAAAARVGKATVELVVDKMRSPYYNKQFDKSSSAYPQNAEQFSQPATLSLYKTKISNIHNMAHVTTNVRSVDEAIDNLLLTFGTQPHVANSKLQQITWLNEILSLPKNKLNSFATDMVFIAKKEGTRYGPFAKIF